MLDVIDKCKCNYLDCRHYYAGYCTINHIYCRNRFVDGRYINEFINKPLKEIEEIQMARIKEWYKTKRIPLRRRLAIKFLKFCFKMSLRLDSFLLRSIQKLQRNRRTKNQTNFSRGGSYHEEGKRKQVQKNGKKEAAKTR